MEATTGVETESAIDDPTVVRSAAADDRERLPRGEKRREQILKDAVAILAEKGYRGIRIAEIAERVGMTHPGLLYYFGSKERLLFEVVKERVAHEQADVTEVFGAKTASLTRLGDLARDNIESAVFVRLYMVLGAESYEADAPLHDYFVDRFKFTRRMAKRALRNDVANGLLRDDIDIDAMALELVSFIAGLEHQWLLDPESVDYVGAMEAYAQRLLTNLAPTKKKRR